MADGAATEGAEMSDDIDVIDTPEYRAGYHDGLKTAATYMDMRGEQFERGTDHVLGMTMRNIWREEAENIRALSHDNK